VNKKYKWQRLFRIRSAEWNEKISHNLQRGKYLLFIDSQENIKALKKQLGLQINPEYLSQVYYYKVELFLKEIAKGKAGHILAGPYHIKALFRRKSIEKKIRLAQKQKMQGQNNSSAEKRI